MTATTSGQVAENVECQVQVLGLYTQLKRTFFFFTLTTHCSTGALRGPPAIPMNWSL